MAQNTLIETATLLMAEHKASKKLSTAVLALLEEYSKTSKKDTVQREKNITLDGTEYRWCNRHEVYEPTTNFKQKDACKLAVKAWAAFGARLKKLQASLEVEHDMEILTDQEKLDVLSSDDLLKKEIKELKEVRGGRYDFEGNQLQFPEIPGYNYDAGSFLTDADLA